MRWLLKHALIFAVSSAGIWLIASSIPANAAASDPAMRKADRDFVKAVAKADTAILGELLDADFTWTDSSGKVKTKAQVLQSPPQPAISPESDADSKEYDYGRIADIQQNLGRLHVLRVWVKRPAGWKAIVYQEVTSLGAVPSFSPGPGQNCKNPCKTVSYQPRNEAERGVVSAYEKLETSAFENNSAVFSVFAANEFVAASSNSNKVYDKRGRMEDLDRVKKAGLAPTPLSAARMSDFGNAMLMISLHKPDRGRPLHVTRIWVKRNGHWMEALSYQTSIQEDVEWNPAPAR